MGGSKRQLLVGLALIFLAVEPSLNNHVFAEAAHVRPHAHGKTAPFSARSFMKQLEEEEDTKVAAGLQTKGKKVSSHVHTRNIQEQMKEWSNKSMRVILIVSIIVFSGFLIKWSIQHGIYGQITRGEFNGHGEPYGLHSALTRGFHTEANIGLIGFCGMSFFFFFKEVRAFYLVMSESSKFHDNEDGSLDLETAGALLLPQFARESLGAFIQNEGQNPHTISLNMNVESLPADMVAPTRNNPNIGTRGNQTDVPMTEQMWLSTANNGANVDTLRLLIRYFFVDANAAKKLKMPKDNEVELLDLAYLYSVYNFKRMQVRGCVERGYTDIMVDPETGENVELTDACLFYYFKDDADPDKYKWAPETKGDYKVVGTVQKDKAWVLKEVRELPDKIEAVEKELTMRLAGAWANLGRFSDFKAAQETEASLMARAEELTSIILVILGVVPAIRSYTAADPECQFLMSVKGRILQGVPRHGPTDDTLPLPEIHNAVGWDCGNNVMVKPVGDITCTLMCNPGYGPSYGNTYCRNLGGVGTEWTHLCTGDGLPVAHTALISPQCCISSAEAPTLSNYTVETTISSSGNKQYQFKWSHKQGFGYSCGRNQALLMSVCRASSANSNFDNARLCSKVCDGAISTSATCSQVQVSLGDREYWDVPWNEVADKGTHSDFKARTFAANYEMAESSIIGNVEAPATISGSDTLLYRLSIANSIYGRGDPGSVWYESDPRDKWRDQFSAKETGSKDAVFPEFPKGSMGNTGNSPQKENDNMVGADESKGAVHGPWTYAADAS